MTTSALYSAAQIRAIEQAAMGRLPPGTLMRRAGKAAADAALALLPSSRDNARVLILAGPGNNGGDALEAAFHLAADGVAISVALFADPDRQSPDAQQALARARSGNADFLDLSRLSGLTPGGWSLIVDGLFGIGLTRPISGMQRAVVEAIGKLDCPVLALDIPSGLDADSGAVVGKDGMAIRATHTITFIGNKPGLYTAHGRDHAGRVQVADLELEPEYFPEPLAQLNRPALFSELPVPRRHNSHKGSYGDVAVIGGAHGMAGAAILAARTAARCGAGRVYAGFLDQPPAYDPGQPELMCRVAGDLDVSAATVVIGPGIGMSRTAHDVLAQALAAAPSLVIDADALNLIAVEPGLQRRLTERRNPALLTPHPLEAARLLGCSSAEVQQDRIAAARELSGRFHAVAVLKGSGTVLAHPDGDIAVNPTGNPALATAGTGDVLAGLCGALLAQHWPAWQAALGGTWLHGAAADALTEQGVGPVGLTAGELIPCIRTILNRLTKPGGQ
jgi:hydroxyethylthiazole kinase-like uncharacterized protein yjeF